MRYDDPLKQIREMNRQFDLHRELTRGPLDEINRIFREQRDLYELPTDQLGKALSAATAYRPMAMEVERCLNLVREHNRAAVAELAIGEAWAQQKAFYQAIPLTLPSGQSPIDAARDAAKHIGDAYAAPISTFQNTLRKEFLSTHTLIESIPALKLDEQLGQLVEKVKMPQVGSLLTDLREAIHGLIGPALLSKEVLGQIHSLASVMDLPYLGAAALQWSAALQENSVATLAAEPLLQSTLSMISGAANGSPSDGLENLLQRWERLVESEEKRHEGQQIQSLLQGFLLNLLFFLLSLYVTNPVGKEFPKRLDRLESGQAAIVESIDDQKKEESLELAAIRQALQELADDVDVKEPAEANLRIAQTNLHLRSTPSADGTVLLTIPKGSSVEILEERGEWCRVKAMNFARGQFAEGWSATEYLQEWEHLDD